MLRTFPAGSDTDFIIQEYRNVIVLHSWKGQPERNYITIEELKYLLDEITQELPPETKILLCPNKGIF